jgi:tRNA A-37 threonylcarbamoyl transferase component Bud32
MGLSGREPQFGRFAVKCFHAKGGLGEVHVAVDEELHREVALKRMQERCAHDPAARRRFLNEAEITARLEHPGIVPIYGLVHDENDQPCYAMRFIAGQSFSEAIREFHHTTKTVRQRFNSVAFRNLLQRFISVCQTVAYAHSKNVIHRDIKPANVMLGPFGETLVVDWGLARDLGSREPRTEEPTSEDALLGSTLNFDDSPADEHLYTKAGCALGTLGYMAPEQAAGRWHLVGPASDIYSLGATLYEMLTDERPVHGSDRLEALQKAQAGDFPPPRQIQPEAPPALEAICLKAMAQKPEHRYASAADLATDVEHCLADEPITAYAAPWTERAGRWARKHRTGVAGLGAAALVALMGLVIGSLVLARKNSDLHHAQDAETRRAEGERLAKDEARKAESAAKNERDRANSERDIAVAVRDFLQRDLLRQASPWTQAESLRRGGAAQRAKYNPTVRELLDRAAQALTPDSIDRKFPNQPLLQIEILETVGETYAAIGEDDKAIELLTSALDLQLIYFGANHAATLVSRVNLAVAYFRVGRFADAAAQIINALRAIDATLNGNRAVDADSKSSRSNQDPDASEAMALIDAVLRAFDKKFADLPGFFNLDVDAKQKPILVLRMVEANVLLERILKAIETRIGPNDLHAHFIRYLLGFQSIVVGHEAEALRTFEAALAGIESDPDATHSLKFVVRSSVALLCERNRKLPEAITHYQRLERDQEMRFGPDHPHSLFSMCILANCYALAGQKDKALPLLEHAFSRQKLILGPEHPQTLLTMSWLARTYQQNGKLPEAVRLFEQVRDPMVSQFGPDHKHTIVMLQNLATAYKDAGRLKDAIPALEQLRASQVAQLGPSHAETMKTLTSLVAAYRAAGKSVEVIRVLKQIRDIQAAKLGLDHPSTMKTIHELVEAHWAAGQFWEACPLLEQVRDIRLAKLGSDHPDTLLAFNNLGVGYWQTRQLDKSIPVFEEAWQRRRAALGADDPATLVTQADLGINYRDAGRVVEGTALLEDALTRRQARPGATAQDLEFFRTALAETYDRAGAHAKAEAVYRDHLQAARQQFGAEDSHTAVALANLGQNLFKQQKWQDAELVLRDCLAIRQKKEPDDWRTFNAQSMLGRALLGQRSYADAEPLLLGGYEGMKQREEQISSPAKARLSEAAERLIKLYDSWGKKSEADKWRKVLASRLAEILLRDYAWPLLWGRPAW